MLCPQGAPPLEPGRLEIGEHDKHARMADALHWPIVIGGLECIEAYRCQPGNGCVGTDMTCTCTVLAYHPPLTLNLGAPGCT